MKCHCFLSCPFSFWRTFFPSPNSPKPVCCPSCVISSVFLDAHIWSLILWPLWADFWAPCWLALLCTVLHYGGCHGLHPFVCVSLLDYEFLYGGACSWPVGFIMPSAGYQLPDARQQLNTCLTNDDFLCPELSFLFVLFCFKTDFKFLEFVGGIKRYKWDSHDWFSGMLVMFLHEKHLGNLFQIPMSSTQVIVKNL